MKAASWIAVLSLMVTAAARADEGPPPEAAKLRAQVADLQRTVEELKRQNATLRTQWGQATMEINRLRAQIASLKATPADTGAAAAQPAHADAPPPLDAPPDAPAAEPAATRATLERLQEQNEDLRIRNRELTALAGLGPQDERVATQEARIKSSFDSSAGRTVVRTEQERLRMTAGTRADHFLSLAYSFEGQSMTSPPAEVTMFIQAVYSGGIYAKDRPLTLTIDGQPVTVAVADYDADRRSTSIAGRRRVSKDDETVTFLLDAELLRKLARAVSVTGRMGVASFELTRDQIALFAAVKKRIDAGM